MNAITAVRMMTLQSNQWELAVHFRASLRACQSTGKNQ